MSKTYVGAIRADIKDVATVARYFIENGVHMRSRSEMLSDAISFSAQMLTINRKVVPFETAEDAKDYLDRHKLSSKLDRSQVKKLAEQIELDSRVVVAVEKEDTPIDELVRRALSGG